ncbi:MAG: diguanylate cyclase [Kangiellaceae bacterium]|jgi:diguanylate cyclase (GGDEF)-like protein|nr:diguanylate cyclase [Kangiellaceae bacterium]
MNNLVTNHSSSDFNKIICRRVPIKLQQFARLMSEIITNEIDPVRVKAMQSQIRKTMETCEEYGVDSTASLLSHIQGQLNLDAETLDSQKPLIKRFITRLESHAERLKLGQINSGTAHAIRQHGDAQQERNELPAATEQQPVASTNQVPPRTSEFLFKTSANNEPQKQPELLQTISQLEVFWCMANNHRYDGIKQQLLEFGYQITEQNLTEAIEQAKSDSQKIVIAHLEDISLDTSQPLATTSNLFLLSEHDNLTNRLNGVRLGSTLFFSEPVDVGKLMEQIDALEHSQTSAPFRVAVMEDSKAQAKYNDKMLSGAGFDTKIIIDPMELLNGLSNFEPEVIFMDMQMPGCNGVELTKVLRQMERFSATPIVFLSAEENQEKQQLALTSGGTAFIEKPVKKEQLLFTAELYARRYRNLQPHLARDFQTGLNSAALFNEQLNVEVERAMRHNDQMFLALLKIDDLAQLNQQYGYAFGERALQQLARLLRLRLRKTDCLGFMSDQTVGVVLNHCTAQQADSVIQYLTQTFISTPIAFEGQEISVNLNVGISQLGSDYDLQRLVRKTEAGLAQAEIVDDNNIIWAHES